MGSFSALAWQGAVIGLADLIPGVSGATVATAIGLYPRLIEGLARPSWSDWRLWVPFGCGVGAAVVAGSYGMVWLLAQPTGRLVLQCVVRGALFWALFVGIRSARPWTWLSLLLVLVGAIMSWGGLCVIVPLVGAGSLWTAGVGAMAATAMLLPGLSGAAVVHLCGCYERLVFGVAKGEVAVLAPFICGGVLGILTIARLIRALSRHWPTQMMAFFTGCMLGAFYR